MSLTVDSSSRTPEPANGTGEAIRRAAIELFAEHGFRGTSMNEIGRAVGIRGSAIYNHVPSKQELLREIISSALHELVDEVYRAIDEAEDIPDRLRRGFAQHVMYHAYCRLETTVGNGEIRSLEEPARSQVVELRRRYVETFDGIIRAGVESGIFKVSSTLIATHAMLQSGMGVAIWFDPDGPLTAREVADFYGELALRMVGYQK